MRHEVTQQEIEGVFISWQLTLEESQQDTINFDHYDVPLKTVFLKREEGFDRSLIAPLTESLRQLNKHLTVSTLFDEKV